jgi:hypothetical protein
VEDKRIRWGVNDPRWKSRVLGEVPDTSLNEMFGTEVMNAMHAKHGFLSKYSFNRGVAIDSSGEGADDNIFMAGSGGEVLSTYKVLTIAPSVAAIKAVEMCKAINGSWIIVDCDGIGIGVYQELIKLPAQYLMGIKIIKFHGSSQDVELLDTGGKYRDEKKKIYFNRRAEAAFIAKDRGLRGVAAVDPHDRELNEELEADEWFENRSGQIQMIEKKDIKEKLEPPRSPGLADCWKMLQWGFEQGYEEIPTQPQEHQFQRVADSDMSIHQGQYSGNLQQYAD